MTAIGIRKTGIFWLIAAAFLLCLAATPAPAKLYRWVDEDGTVHYSDKLPPEHAKDAHEEIDDKGHTVKDVDRAKTKEERMEEEKRQQQREAEQRKRAEKKARQQRRDEILLQTFTTERDLMRTRNERVEAIDQRVNMTISNNDRLEERINDARERVERLKNNDREVPDNLTRKLENLREQYDNNQRFIDSKRQEREEVEAKFDADLKRFRELKGQDEAEQADSDTPPASGESAPENKTESPAPPADVSPAGDAGGGEQP